MVDRSVVETKLKAVGWLVFLLSRALIFLGCDLATGDVEIYHRNAMQALTGGNPYSGEGHFGYPPLALLYVILPALLSGPRYAVYYQLFRIESYLVDLAIFSLIQARSKDPRSGLLYSLATFVLGNLIYHRLDLMLGLLCLLPILLHARGKGGSAYTVLGAAVAFKLIPIVLVPAAIAWEWKGSRARAVRSLAMVSLGALVPTLLGLLVLGPNSVIALSGHAERGIQLESLWASLTWLLGGLGIKREVYFAAGSYNLKSPLETTFVYASYLSLLLVVLFSVVFALTSRERAPQRLSLLLLCVLLSSVTLSKVLSPQFLLVVCTLFPAAWESISSRRSASALLLLSALLTTAVYPYKEQAMIELLPRAMVPLCLRNTVLVALSVVLARDLLRGQPVQQSGAVSSDPSSTAPLSSERRLDESRAQGESVDSKS